MCYPLEEGGLGIRSIIKVNESYNLKLAWDLHNSMESWAVLLRQRVLRKGCFIKHHINSSLWTSMKYEVSTVEENTTWMVVNGSSINLWSDSWCGKPLLFAVLDISNIIEQSVCSIISNGRWDFSKALFPIPLDLQERTLRCHIPIVPRPDGRVWTDSPNGDITAKISFNFKRSIGLCKDWWQWIWSKSIPPFKSAFVWKLLYCKVSTDEQWHRRNFSFPSRCCLCKEAQETTHHLFFNCKFASFLWSWLSKMLNISSPILDWPDLWALCRKFGSGQCKIVSTAAIVFILNAIWLARNRLKFQDAPPSIQSSISSIVDSVALAGGSPTVGSFLNMQDFVMLKNFHVPIRPRKAPNILEVIWKPPPRNWIKINCDGTSSPSGLSACGGIARNSDGNFLGAFADFLGVANSLIAELSGAMMAIEFAYEKNWSNIWLETDSTAVVKAFNSPYTVPWFIRNRWFNCISLVANWNFVVSHIYREGNSCADTLASLGLNITSSTYFASIPICLRADFVKNRIGMPFYRFISS
ncbi:uncharacterized protein LOC131633112 [Vicia villosa]|uniref:uncharacterized protein LOC131633112 n=1 Tax=Vicia villosa TaxID=3911 RepID=UPI00273C483E|nr:uncharacterized protein LOC131633112 [Vicia villosa]